MIFFLEGNFDLSVGFLLALGVLNFIIAHRVMLLIGGVGLIIVGIIGLGTDLSFVGFVVAAVLSYWNFMLFLKLGLMNLNDTHEQ